MSAQQALPKDQPASDLAQWQAVLAGFHEEFEFHLMRALKDGDSKPIHKARVNGRKLLTLLKQLDPDNRTGLAAYYRKGMKRLGKVRDADVLIDAFEERRKRQKKAGHKKQARLLKAVVRMQRKKRKTSRARLAKEMRDFPETEEHSRWERWLKEDLEELLDKVQADRIMGELGEAYEQKKRVYREQCREAGMESAEAFDALHDLRIAAKEIRYMAASASFALDGKFQRWEKRFQGIQDELGAINDRRVWLETVERLRPERLSARTRTWNRFRKKLRKEIRALLLENRVVKVSLPSDGK
ncbi:CHAD domain-containing protein [Paenibacillus sp. CC-CFT747]|nr:CHAD domain-containing protein [Paenibacillus sp. CC-CFT747]